MSANDMRYNLSISYLLAKLSKLLIHRLGSPKGVVAGISVIGYFFH